jgi:hypothetical protein
MKTINVCVTYFANCTNSRDLSQSKFVNNSTTENIPENTTREGAMVKGQESGSPSTSTEVHGAPFMVDGEFFRTTTSFSRRQLYVKASQHRHDRFTAKLDLHTREQQKEVEQGVAFSVSEERGAAAITSTPGGPAPRRARISI